MWRWLARLWRAPLIESNGALRLVKGLEGYTTLVLFDEEGLKVGSATLSVEDLTALITALQFRKYYAQHEATDAAARRIEHGCR